VDATADNACIHLEEHVTAPRIRDADVASAIPVVSPQALAGLKFSAALPPDLAAATLAERIVDRAGARGITGRPLVVRTGDGTQVLEW
jgi:ATP-dependent helicase Lhr and Lhr-like helicase